MRVSLLAAPVVLLGACAHPPVTAVRGAPPEAPAAALRLELRVDPAAAPGAKDTFRALEDALAQLSGRAARIHLAAGRYKGPFTVPDGVHLVGEGATVLYVDEGPVVLSCAGAVRLERLTVQGGATGVEVRGSAELEAVTLSGQRQTGVHVLTGGVIARRLEVMGTVGDTLGLKVDSGARLQLSDSSFHGPLREAVALAAGSTARIDGLSSEGPFTALKSLDAHVTVRHATASGGRGPAFFFTGGEASLEDVSVFGHEYALLTGTKNTLTARDFTSMRADRAGIGLVATHAQLSNVLVVDSGNYGGIQSINSDLALEQFIVSGCKGYGVMVNSGTADLQDGAISRISDASGSDGDALHLRRSRVRATSLTIRGADGSGVFAAESAEVALRDLLIEETGWGGLVGETGARIEAASVWVRDTKGAAVAVPGDATVRADLLVSVNNAQGDVWAECAQGARVFLSRFRSEAPEGVSSPCVRTWEQPRVFDPFAERR